MIKYGSQKQIAFSAKISQPHLSQILNDHRRPSWPVAKRLAAATGTDPADWMEGGERLEEALLRAHDLPTDDEGGM